MGLLQNKVLSDAIFDYDCCCIESSKVRASLEGSTQAHFRSESAAVKNPEDLDFKCLLW